MKVTNAALTLVTLLSKATAGSENAAVGDEVFLDTGSMSHPPSKSLLMPPDYLPEGLFDAAAATVISSKSSKATSSKAFKPSSAPSLLPSTSSLPSFRPSTSSMPSLQPSTSSIPTLQPSTSSMPSLQPSTSSMPSSQPSTSSRPSSQPSTSSMPSSQPSTSSIPSLQPSTSSMPSSQPSTSSMPSLQPSTSAMPSSQPSTSSRPSSQPSTSSRPSSQPSTSSRPSSQPSTSSMPSSQPSTSTVIRGPLDGQILVGGPGYGSIQDTFNQASLNPPYVSGATPFDSYMASHTSVFSGYEWFSDFGLTAATVLYDLGNEFTISGLVLWNEESNDSKDVTLYSSSDGITFTQIITFTPTDTPRDQDYFNEMIPFSPVMTRYIKYEMFNCVDSEFQSCSIGEVAFRSSV